MTTTTVPDDGTIPGPEGLGGEAAEGLHDDTIQTTTIVGGPLDGAVVPETSPLAQASAERPYTVVVGINGSQQSHDALRWAVAQAEMYQGRVIALRTWRTPTPAATPAGTTSGRVGTTEATEADVRESLARAVEAALGADHRVELRVERGGRKKAFVAISHEADLIVLGAPRKLSAGPMFAHRLVYATACPVVVMPPEPSGPSVAGRVAQAAGRAVITAAGTAGRPGHPPVAH